MKAWQLVLLLAAGAAMTAGSLLLRVRTKGQVEVKTGDLVFLVVPLLLVALATGRLKELTVGDVRLDLSALWTSAAQAQIESQVARAAPATVEDVMHLTGVAAKGGVQEIPRIIARKTEALSFRLGAGGYYAPAIRVYLEKLSGSAYLRYLVLQNPDGSLFGMYAARTLVGWLGVGGDPAYGEFERLLNSGGDAARAALARLPGFVGAESAVRPDTSKRDALARMAQLDVDSLPVVDAQRRFAGTIERAKLTASLILAVTDKVESAGTRGP